MQIRIVCPWPPGALTPNAKRRLHWSRYSPVAKRYRIACWTLAREALGLARFAAPPSVKIEFHPPDARHRDDDNMVGAFKAGRDGIAEAIAFDDRHWRPAYTFHPPHRPAGQVVVTIEGEAKV